MKQHITAQQLNELSDKAKEKLRDKEFKCSHCKKLKLQEQFWSRKPSKKWSRPVQSWCKECVRRHKRLDSSREKQKQYNYKWRNEHKSEQRQYLDQYKEENLEKVRARDFVRNAVRRYGLQKLPCRECGSLKVQAHHYNGYSRKHYLDVIWLCPLHHADYEKRSLASC